MVYFGNVLLFVVQISTLYSEALFQKAMMYPATPARVLLSEELTLMCKTKIQKDWRSTSFYDETYQNGHSSILLFNKVSDGSCKINVDANSGYKASCDSSKGEFNLTILSVGDQYHNRFIRCEVQFGNGTLSDKHRSANSTIYVRVLVSNVLLTNNTIIGDVTRDVNIKCKATSRPAAEISWVKINAEGISKDISLSSVSSILDGTTGYTVTSVLTYKYNIEDNMGQLYCRADNVISARNSSVAMLNIYYPPPIDPTIQQTPNRPVNAGERVVLACSVSGGHPLPALTWNCSGNITDRTSGSTVFHTVVFMSAKEDNGKICACSATHPVTAYRPVVSLKLDVNFLPDTLPVIDQVPTGAVDTNSSIMLKCTVKGGKPLAILTWNCTGNITTNTSEDTSFSIVEFSVTKHNHGMVCICLATHSIASYQHTARHIVNVIYPPDDNPYTEQAIPGPIDTGKSVTLKCTAVGGNPLASLSWDCAGITSNISTNTKSILSVEFTVDKNYNSKLCTCHATHSIKSYSPISKHELIVYYPPTKPSLTYSFDMPWLEGNITEIKCISVAGNPKSTFEWTSNEMRFTENKSMLTIGPLVGDDNGKAIKCVVKNDYTIRNRIILTSDLLYMDVEYSPEIKVEKSILYAVEGYNKSIACFALGHPFPEVQWFLNDIALTESHRNVSFLQLKDIDRVVHHKKYKCRAVSKSPKYGLLKSEHTIEIFVYYTPNITSLEAVSGNITPENDSTTLRCQVDSNPKANITWVFVSNQTELQSDYNVSDSNFTILTTSCQHFGIYQCQATNTVNGLMTSDIQQTELRVKCAPRIDHRQHDLLKRIAVEVNSPVNITLYLIAYPKPQMRWIFENNEVNSTSISNGITNILKLYIPRLAANQFGEYILYVQNAAGSMIKYVTFIKKGKPISPSDVFVVCKITTASLHWKSEFNGGLIQYFHIQFWDIRNDTNTKTKENITDPGELTTLQYTIQNLKSNQAYRFAILSTNFYGTSSSTVVECKTDSEESNAVRENKNKRTLSTAGVAGLSAGLVLLFIIILAVIVYIKRRKPDMPYITPTSPDPAADRGVDAEGYQIVDHVDDNVPRNSNCYEAEPTSCIARNSQTEPKHLSDTENRRTHRSNQENVCNNVDAANFINLNSNAQAPLVGNSSNRSSNRNHYLSMKDQNKGTIDEHERSKSGSTPYTSMKKPNEDIGIPPGTNDSSNKTFIDKNIQKKVQRKRAATVPPSKTCTTEESHL